MAINFANKITIGRILSVPFFVSTVLYYTPDQDHLRFVALCIFICAVISDYLDGYIARTRYEKTKAGAILDPLADKLLLMSAFICLYKIGDLLPDVSFPIWFVVAVISRDIILLIGAMIIYLENGDLIIEASFMGKITALFQILSVITILMQWIYSPYIWYLTLIFTAISCIDYIRKGMKIINKETLL